MKKETETANYYDGIANGYNQLYHEEQKKKIIKILKYIPTNGIILDAGAGTGFLNEFIDKKVILFSLDISKKMLEKNNNINNRKINASLTKIPFENEKFECIISMTVLQDIENFNSAILEIKRVLKKGKLFICSFLSISKNSEKINLKLKKNFKIIEEIKGEKDKILILRK